MATGIASVAFPAAIYELPRVSEVFVGGSESHHL